MSFTMAKMRQMYAKYGALLVMFTEKGEGPFSADPRDYWQMLETDKIDGYLRVRIPESFVPVEDLKIPESA